MMLNLGREAAEQERRWIDISMWKGPGTGRSFLLALMLYATARGPIPVQSRAVVSLKREHRPVRPVLLVVELASILLLGARGGLSPPGASPAITNDASSTTRGTAEQGDAHLFRGHHPSRDWHRDCRVHAYSISASRMTGQTLGPFHMLMSIQRRSFRRLGPRLSS